jgi:hypothetical protein
MIAGDERVPVALIAHHGSAVSVCEFRIGSDPGVRVPDSPGGFDPGDAGHGKRARQPEMRREGGAVVEQRRHFDDDREPEMTPGRRHDRRPGRAPDLDLDRVAVIHRR